MVDLYWVDEGVVAAALWHRRDDRGCRSGSGKWSCSIEKDDVAVSAGLSIYYSIEFGGGESVC
jgi:hypothetical protein